PSRRKESVRAWCVRLAESCTVPSRTALPPECENCKHVRAEDLLRRINAALEEQARAIGQSLHDEAGQLLTAAHNALAAAAESATPEVCAHLDAVKRHLDDIEQQLRRLAYELRPRVLDDLGLVPAIRSLIDGVHLRGDLRVAFAARIDGPLPDTIETAVYRLMQEAITNVRRHARATRVVVELEERRGTLRCRISDNGVGFDPTSRRKGPGLGLRG